MMAEAIAVLLNHSQYPESTLWNRVYNDLYFTKIIGIYPGIVAHKQLSLLCYRYIYIYDMDNVMSVRGYTWGFQILRQLMLDIIHTYIIIYYKYDSYFLIYIDIHIHNTT